MPCWNSLTEKYYVTFVKGSVIVSKTKLPVKIGDVLTEEDKLIFKDLSSKVSCIHPTKGRYDITPIKAKSSGDNELVAILKPKIGIHTAVTITEIAVFTKLFPMSIAAINLSSLAFRF